MPVKMMRRMTAAPAPKIMPHSRWRGARPRQASAITSALSPDNSTLIQMILPTATQNAGCTISARNWMKNAPMFAGSNICHNQFTARPFGPVVLESRLSSPLWFCWSADDLVARKKLGGLDRRGFRCIRSVHRVFADRFRVQLADGAFGRLGGIGRAHDVAVFQHGALALEHLNDDRTGDHEVHQFAKERPRLVHGIEGFGLFAGHANPLLRHDPQACLFDQRVDRAGQIARGRVGLDDREGAFNRHDLSLENDGGSCGAYIGAIRLGQADPVTRLSAHFGSWITAISPR